MLELLAAAAAAFPIGRYDLISQHLHITTKRTADISFHATSVD